MSDIAISVSNVSKCYRVFDDQRSRLLHAVLPARSKGMQEVWALKDINFEIKRGESVAIIGRNGSGKSTLLEILTGTLTPTTGNVKVNGRVSALLELGSGFNPEYSGRDNVILNGLLLGLSKDDILSRFGEIEAFAEIGASIDRPVKTYSSGMMMRLAFAVQVLCDPDILIIDEALSVGDFFFQQKCLGFIKNLCANGVTLLFVSHDMGSVRDICSRAIYLKSGCVISDGTVFEGISRFFKESITSSSGTASNYDIQQQLATAPSSDGQSGKCLKILRDALWCNEQSDPTAQLIAIALYDELGEPTTSFQLGKEMLVRVLFSPAPGVENHVALAILDKSGGVRSATGSLLKKLSGFMANEVGLFEIKIQLMIEAGEYGLLLNLGYEIEKNRGAVVHETPIIGPINVTWDYERETAPFLGQVGLPVSARFVPFGEAE